MRNCLQIGNDWQSLGLDKKKGHPHPTKKKKKKKKKIK